MNDIPYLRLKRTVAVLLLAALGFVAHYTYKSQKNSLAGFEPSQIKDDREQKIQALLELLKLEPNDFKTHGELAKIYFSFEDFSGAESHALKAIAIGEKQGASKDFLAEQYLLLSKIYQAQGKNDLALEYAEKAQEINPTKTAPLKRTGQVFEALKKNSKARLAYLRALKLDENDPETYSLLANQEFKKGNKKEALEWLKMGVRKNPTNATAFRNLARGYARTKQNEKAREAYEQALKLAPKDAALRYEYAKFLKKIGDEKGYMQELRRAHEVDPKNSKIAEAMGDAELQGGNKKRALELYRDALKGDGRNASLREKYTNLYDSMKEVKSTSVGGNSNSSEKTGGQSEANSGNSNGNTASGGGGSESSANSGGKEASESTEGGSKNNETKDKENRIDEAKNNNAQSGDTKGQGGDADFEAGKKALADKDLAAAEAHFRKALEKNPNHSRAHYQLGKVLYQGQKFNQAAAHFKKAVDADEKFAPAQYSYALALDKQGKHAEALDAYKKAALIDPKLSQAHFNSAIIHKKNKRYDEALAELAKSGEGNEVEYQRGEIQLKQKNYDAAKESFGKVLNQNPQHYEAAFNLALAHHKLKDPAGADRVLAKVIRDDSPADLNYTYGKLLEESGEIAGAEKQYRASTQKDPKYFKGWLNLGRINAARGAYDQAEAAYRQALQIDSNSYDASLNLANTLFKQKKFQAAAEYFETARKHEASREIIMPLGQSYEESGQNDKAAKVYSDFIAANAKDRIALERLGYLYYRKIKNKEKALEQFQKLLKYYPDSEKASEYKGIIQLIEKSKNE